MNASKNPLDGNNAELFATTMFIMHEDPGHAWLEVPFQLLKKLRIEKKITGFSYRKGGSAFLEEDQDLTTFIKAYFSHCGILLTKENIQEFWNNKTRASYFEHSPVRNYSRFYI